MTRNVTASSICADGGCAHLRRVAILALALGAASPAAAQKVVTDEDVSVSDVMLTPLADLNLSKDPIPPVLVRAHAAPYDDSGLSACPEILQEIGNLDAVLGEDFDTAVRTRKRASAESVAQGVVEGFIPFRGLIRHFSGADRHAWEFKEAITAGLARRAFLKGLGQGMDCPYPARPVPPGLLVYPETASENGELQDVLPPEPAGG